MNTNGKLITRDGVFTTDTGTESVLDAVNDTAVADCEDLTNVEVWVNQLVNAGTATLVIYKSIDGVNWATVATLTDASFAAANNAAVATPLEGTNGMPLHAKQIKVVCTVEGSDGGSYSFSVAGRQLSHAR